MRYFPKIFILILGAQRHTHFDEIDY